MQSNEIVYTPFNNQVLVSENHALLSSTYTVPTYDISSNAHTPPSSSRFPLHLSSHAQSTYLLQFFLLSPFPDLRDRSLKCYVSSWLWRRFVDHLLFLSFRHCELHATCKQWFLVSGMTLSIL